MRYSLTVLALFAIEGMFLAFDLYLKGLSFALSACRTAVGARG